MALIILKYLLYIIISVVLFVVVLLFIPASFCVKYSDEFKLSICVLGIPFSLDRFLQDSDDADDKNSNKPKKTDTKQDKSNGKNDKKDEKKKTSFFSKFKNLFKRKGLDGFIQFLRESAKFATGSLKSVFSRLTLSKFELDITVATGDSADTAIKYGYTCAAAYPAISLFLNTMKYKKYSIDIHPDFDEKKSEIKLNAKITFIPWLLLFTLLSVLFKFIKLKAAHID